MEIIKERTKEFKIPIGYHFKDDRRDLIIIDRKRKGSFKCYKYKCNTCNFDGGKHYKNEELVNELWTNENDLLRGRGCSCCGSKIVVSSINSIAAKEHWMVNYFVNKEQANMYAPTSNKKVEMRCVNCGRKYIQKKAIDKLYAQKRMHCDICSDGISYPEKIIRNMLIDTGINFITELNKSTFGWCDNYRYDFYIPSNNTIIEIHGKQHYEQSTGVFKRIENQREVDEIKKLLAIANGVNNYIVIDARKSELEFIKDNIINSKLSKIYDLSKVDWNTCHKMATKSLAKSVCEEWDNGSITVIELADKYNISKVTVRGYLKKFSEHYNAQEEIKKSSSKNGKKLGITTQIIKDGIVIGVFESATELERQSEELFGVKLSQKSISRVISGERNHHKGFTFKYVDTNKEEIA